MRFQVPQFIEIEDKIFGQLTFKQFIYLAGGVGGSIVLYIYIPFKIISIILIIPLLALSGALAFYKVNGKSFIDVIESSFYFYTGNKLYLWKKAERKPKSKIEDQMEQMRSTVSVPRLSDSKLKDLTWSLDIKEALNPVTREEK
ncbi:MAG: PrgI family protein [Candidatus Paceibacterota bacterium]|nr:PrgI family protein [Candidatus Paceibacterota bacterium]